MLKNNFIVLVLLISPLFAQKLTLNESITKAINSHPDIKSFILQNKKSSIGVEVAKADYLPQISLNAEYNPLKTYAIAQNGVFNTTDDNGWQLGATLNQKIWDFGKTVSIIGANKTAFDISKLSLKEAKIFLAYKVKLQYELMFVQKEAIIVREKDLESKQELYKQANTLVTLGMKTKADASRFLSSLYIAKDNLGIAKADYLKAKMILSNYINEEIANDVELDNTFLKNDLTVIDKVLYKNILKNNLQLQSLNKNIEVDELLYRATKSSHYGSIDAVASYSRQKTLNEYDSSLLGITLKIPIFTGNKTTTLVEQSLLQKQSDKENLNSKVLELQEEIEILIIDFKRYKQTIQTKKLQLESTKQTKVLLEARYKEGLSTYIEILDATSLYLNAKLGLLEAKYAKSSILNRLKYLEGKI